METSTTTTPTTEKKNCWEFKQCGREPQGSKVKELGVCPAATDISANEVNNGINGGRFCWAIAGTFCGGVVQGDFAKKEGTCMACQVMQTVKKEEGPTFKLFPLAKKKV